jgi:hypothetical protein
VSADEHIGLTLGTDGLAAEHAYLALITQPDDPPSDSPGNGAA